jgi:hypothetical protein
MIYLSSDSASAKYLFDRKNDKYVTFTEPSGSASELVITFDTPRQVNNIIFGTGISAEIMKIYYNSNTANLFSIFEGGTTVSDWTYFQDGILQFNATSIAVSSLHIMITKGYGSTKSIGEVWILDKVYELESNPSAKNYKAKYDRKSFEHVCSDGGTAIYFLQDNFTADIKMENVSSIDWGILKYMYDLHEPFVFIPGITRYIYTAASSDTKSLTVNGGIYECNWIGDFDFLQYWDNTILNGYEGTIKLRETPK